jgi:hypothetical protein
LSGRRIPNTPTVRDRDAVAGGAASVGTVALGGGTTTTSRRRTARRTAAASVSLDTTIRSVATRSKGRTRARWKRWKRRYSCNHSRTGRCPAARRTRSAARAVVGRWNVDAEG